MAQTWVDKIIDQNTLVQLATLKIDKALAEGDEPAFHRAVDELQAANTGLASLKGKYGNTNPNS